ncbi:rhomboid family intramembrane serine protease GlpG [Aestuariibacter salexigens]|uniref:rhomboid family intramembrane serine protease GlpG n=1 Tax=Aestuariibacter salexigens TaxID=226010 RepID=UPI0003FF26B0|nr:rhomboid family intramembrane serine protease GlpG [Aestuariibacter salexigens]
MSKPVVAFSIESPARLLVDYLNSQSIQSEYQRFSGEHPHTVVILDDNDEAAAKGIVEEFIANPEDQKYQQTAWSQGQSVKLSDDSSGPKTPVLQVLKQAPFTSLIMLLCISVYVLLLLGFFREVFAALGMQSLDVLAVNHQWWRLIGPDFIHFSATHIVFNLLWWWILGKDIERVFGSSSLIILFLLSSLAANLGQLMTSGPNFGGLSGVVYAVFGFVWWIGVLRPSWGLSLPRHLIGFMLIWLVLGYADVLWVNMANTAHTLGLISGCAFAWVMSRLKATPQP